MEAAGVVERYVEHLRGKAASAVRVWSSVGVLAGIVLGAAPGRLNHSLISAGVTYFAVLLGAIAGGIAGRSFGERRATGLRLQAELVLHQARVERALLEQSKPVPAAVPAPPITPPIQLVAPQPAQASPPVTPTVSAPPVSR
jgi:hypothetical protein